MAKSFDSLVAKTTKKKVRERGVARGRRYLAEMLQSEVRWQHGISQKQLAEALRMKQPSLSKLEGQQDMQISTLQKIVEPLGGRLVINAEFPDGQTKLKQFRHARTARGRELELVHCVHG